MKAILDTKRLANGSGLRARAVWSGVNSSHFSPSQALRAFLPGAYVRLTTLVKTPSRALAHDEGLTITLAEGAVYIFINFV